MGPRTYEGVELTRPMKYNYLYLALAASACVVLSDAKATEPNPLIIGTLSDNTTPGATLQFSDTGTQAMFGNALGRTAAQWTWWRVDPANASGFVPTMVVDSVFGLALYDPADPSTATIKLNPDPGTASEMPKLKLTNQTLDADGSVLTRALGDARYLKSSDASSTYLTISEAASQFLPLTSNTIAVGENTTVAMYGIGVGYDANSSYYAVSVGYFAGSNGPNSPASGYASVAIGYQARSPGAHSITLGMGTWAGGDNSIALGFSSTTREHGAIAIGEGTEANQIGQVVLGAFNELTTETNVTTDSDSIFVIGNGTAWDARSNAFIIKRNGDTQVSGTLTVGGHSVLTQDTADTRYFQKSQILRVAPAGDIDMGEFQTTPPGVTAPAAP